MGKHVELLKLILNLQKDTTTCNVKTNLRLQTSVETSGSETDFKQMHTSVEHSYGKL
ncbi:hypothetical protein POTOM_023536 [Populus tomentosa]|uniref:Uncharacterized protein n=1 Tax=Populus tomentosa TaxID=118781 RepID=A0A8X7ZNG0_POPTO|nr:hypothetical protein POTOM_023536 [Populus tomentosa]